MLGTATPRIRFVEANPRHPPTTPELKQEINALEKVADLILKITGINILDS